VKNGLLGRIASLLCMLLNKQRSQWFLYKLQILYINERLHCNFEVLHKMIKLIKFCYRRTQQVRELVIFRSTKRNIVEFKTFAIVVAVDGQSERSVLKAAVVKWGKRIVFAL